MPNKTIYVSVTDLPTFKKASTLFGKSLSRVIAEAVRRLVQKEESKNANNYTR